MKTPRNTGAIFNTINRLERQMGVDVGLRDTAEHLYKLQKQIVSLPLNRTAVRQQNTARTAVNR